jgi:hypothetical protein
MINKNSETLKNESHYLIIINPILYRSQLIILYIRGELIVVGFRLPPSIFNRTFLPHLH